MCGAYFYTQTLWECNSCVSVSAGRRGAHTMFDWHEQRLLVSHVTLFIEWSFYCIFWWSTPL